MQRAWHKSTRLVLFISFLILSSCSNIFIDVIKTGPDFPPSKRIDVFTTRDDIKKPYGAIAILHSERFDCSEEKQKKILQKAIALGKKNGGDALVYYFDFGEKNPYLEPNERCYFSGALFKYLDDELIKKYTSRDVIQQ